MDNQLSGKERKKYMADGQCFRCAKQGHMACDCPTKNGERHKEKKKLSAQEAYVKIQAIVREQEVQQQTELLDIMEAEAKQTQNSMHIPLSYNNEIGKVGTNMLLDSRAGGLFMSPEKATKLGLERIQLPHRIKVFNVDGTANKTAWIMQSVTAQYVIGTKQMTDTFLISGLGKEEVILGLLWLWKYNPDVDWVTGRTTFPGRCYVKIPRVTGILDFESPEELIYWIDIRANTEAQPPTSQMESHPVVIQSKIGTRSRGEDTDNEDVILLLEHLFINVVDVELQDKLKDRLGSDDFHKMALEALMTTGLLLIKSALSDWEINDSLIRYKGRVYVLDDVVLQRKITWTIHKGQPFGHPGQFGMLDLIQRDYWWPGMVKFVKSFIDRCTVCQQMKINTHPTKVALHPVDTTPNATPFHIITMDLITDLPESDGFDTIMVVVDHSSSKEAIFIPCTKKLDAPQAAELLLQNIYKRYGLPDKIISDRDPRFAAMVFQETMKLLGVKHAMSTAYHPQSDGETERVNQEIEIYLRMFCSKEQTEWSSYLHIVEFAHNNRTHSVTRNSPFFMIIGYHSRPLPMAFKKTSVPSVEEHLNRLWKLQGEVAGMMEIARRKMIERGNRETDKFTVGQKVWLEGKNLDFGYPSKKLSPKREGPFTVKKVMGPMMYRLKLPSQWRIHSVFHTGLLKPYRETEAHRQNFLEPPPDIVDSHEEFEIEAIIGHKPLRKPRRFLVSWKGFDSSHNEWKTKEELEHAMDIYLNYIVKNKL
ncbi:retrotransposon nucleocapsid protein [Moniliophthora roreri MCA 2997]|uniref:Retrotransposon nucleocapsid protein n=1 Tax=Moniliophthora roreri (strain MCA 2997) TaxID=1381753 RepID=V2WPM4_MONRO|nr:retrotransposon nucleocapsid protein [Moniliophthora roreri MCA 2997]